MVCGRVQSKKAGIEGGVDRHSVCRALNKTLGTRSPAFYDDLSVDMAIDTLENALTYKIGSWDGYIVCLAKNHRHAYNK